MMFAGKDATEAGPDNPTRVQFVFMVPFLGLVSRTCFCGSDMVLNRESRVSVIHLGSPEREP